MADGRPPAASGGPRGNPVWRLYSTYGRANLGYALLGMGSTVVGRAFGLVPAYVIGLAVDAVFLARQPYRLPLLPADWIPATDMGQLWFTIAVLLTATVLGAATSWLEDWGWSVFAQRVQHNLRVDAYAHLQSLELAFFTGHRTGELMSVLNNDVNALETFLEDGLSSTFWVGGSIVGIALILATINLPLTVIALLPVPVLAAFTLVFTRIIEPRYLDIREEIGDLNARLENNVTGIEVIKTEGTEGHEAESVAGDSLSYLAANLRAVRIQITYFPGLTLVSGIGFAATFLVGGYWLLRGPPFGLTATLTPGAFVTFVIYAQQFVWPVIQFGNVVDDYERAKAAGIRVDRLFSRPSEVDDAPDATPLAVEAGRVEYDGVTFGYGRSGAVGEREWNGEAGADGDGHGREADPVIEDVSFVVEGGETVGIVGPTGAGKSTLMKLLPRLYDVDAGAIRVDGQDVRDVTVASLRRSIGYVSQEPFLFPGTVRENVRYGTFDATDEEVEAAAERAQAHSFVLNLPDGYDTEIGERGVKLSGGQRQRLALARAFLKDPSILVLDEATSHVDTETEALIQRSLRAFAAERTTFLIAHRLSTVRPADTILVLDEGRVDERGSHEALIEADGLYANFWRVQAGDFDHLPEEFFERASRRVAEVESDEEDPPP